jgi:serine protease Do
LESRAAKENPENPATPAGPFIPPQAYAAPPASFAEAHAAPQPAPSSYRAPYEAYKPSDGAYQPNPSHYYRSTGTYAEPIPVPQTGLIGHPDPRPADPLYSVRPVESFYPRPYISYPGLQEQGIDQPVMPKPKKKKKVSEFWKKTAAAAVVAALAFGTLGLGLGVGGRIAGVVFPSANAKVETEAFAFPADASSYIISNAEKTSANVSDIVKRVSDAVVSINVTVISENYFHQTTETPGAGSGIIFSEDKEKVYIATNEHVISQANSVTISTDDKTEVEAHFVGSDEESDLAVIYVNKADLKEKGVDYKLADFGDSEVLRVGDSVVAVGNAMGEGKTATSGIVSAINKQITVDGKTLDVIQTDAAINPGNSGGALANAAGEVIGINTAKLSANRVEGMGYSIPSNSAKKIIEELINSGSVEKPYLGIQGQSVTESVKEMYNLPSLGVYVAEVIEGGAAAEAGLQPFDIIVGFNDTKITSLDELSSAIADSSVGDEVTIHIYRNGTTLKELKAVLGNMNNATKF